MIQNQFLYLRFIRRVMYKSFQMRQQLKHEQEGGLSRANVCTCLHRFKHSDYVQFEENNNRVSPIYTRVQYCMGLRFTGRRAEGQWLVSSLSASHSLNQPIDIPVIH